MAKHQRKIKLSLKKKLINETGGKCANPGCANWRTHIHHIKRWAVYKTHKSNHMVAICPSCHDDVHYGSLSISDDTLYKWKEIERCDTSRIAHIYVEPAAELKIITGSLCISSVNDHTILFELSNFNKLGIRVLDGDMLQVNSRLLDQNGDEILRVVENNVRVVRDQDITFESRPGRARVTLLANNDYVPTWLVEQMQVQYPEFASDGRIVAIDIEVLRPGLLRVQGCWPDGDVGIVITEEALSFCKKSNIQPISMIGEGERTCLKYTGPITGSLFGFS